MKLELSASTVTFISCRGRLIKVLASAARGEMGSKGAGGRVRLSDVDTWELVNMKLILKFGLTWPPPPSFPVSLLVAPASTLVSLPLQLMKATVLAENSSFIHFHRDLSALAMSTYVSQVGVTLFPSF